MDTASECNVLIAEANELIEDVVSDIDSEIVATADKEEGEKLCALRDQWDIPLDDYSVDDPEYAVDSKESAAALLASLPNNTNNS